MLTLVRRDDTMTSIAHRLGMLRPKDERRSSRWEREDFDRLSDDDKEALEAEFSRRLTQGTAEQMPFYAVLADEYLGEPYVA